MAPFDASAAWPAAPAEPDRFSERFRDALANLASGVAIISCWDGDAPRGLLVSSITGLSLEPPRFLFCVRKEASSHDALIDAQTCGIAILASHDQEEALRFSSSARSGERFDPSRWSLEASRPPTFRGGLSQATCRIDSRIDATTHSVLVVTAVDIALAPAAAPLVACARAFHGLSPLPATAEAGRQSHQRAAHPGRW
jgi:flavin reductase